MARKVTNISPL